MVVTRIRPEDLGPMARRQVALAEMDAAWKQATSQPTKKKRKPSGKRRFSNVPVTISGVKLDSQTEGRRFSYLKALEKSGEIRNLEVHPKYPIVINGMHVCTVIPDFRYVTRNGETVVEDAKGAAAGHALTPVFRLKQRLLMAVEGVDVRVVVP